MCFLDYRRGETGAEAEFIDEAPVGAPEGTGAEDEGLGAEIGISTSKLHAFGPMGARELTTRKFVVEGTGQIRG